MNIPVTGNTVAEVIYNNVKEYPDKEVVKVEGQSITYQEMDDMAERFITAMNRALSGREPGLPIRVAVCIHRNQYLYPAIWAVLKSSFTYIPIDPETPEERLRFILKDSEASLVLSTTGMCQKYGDEKWLDVEELTNSSCTPSVCEEATETVEAPPNDIAYIIYTSGSTGFPKGVMVPYPSLQHLLSSLSNENTFAYSPQMKHLAFLSINFDASIMDSIAVLYHGGTIVLASDAQRFNIKEIATLIAKEQVTSLSLTPSFALLLQDNDLSCVKVFSVGGEKILPEIIQKAAKAPYRLINSYGPTENTITTTVCVAEADTSPENIGFLNPGIVGHVLREDLSEAEAGEVGELCLGGAQLSAGYLNRPELNGQYFFANPFPDRLEAPRLYHSGDLVRLMPDGSYEFKGRKDSQVKYNGFRIELEEIEHHLLQCNEVQEVCVLVQQRNGADQLVAYFKLHENLSADETIPTIKKRLKEFLAHYMIPTIWIPIKEFPVTISGKIDKKQLAKEFAHSQPMKQSRQREPKSHNEEVVCDILCNMLKVEDIHPDADLFDEIGLTSIQVMELSLSTEIAGNAISVNEIYENRTIRKALQAHKERLSFWYNEPRKEKPVLVIVSGYTSFRFLYATVAKELSPYYSIYVLESYHEYPDHLVTSTEVLTDYYASLLEPISREHQVAALTGFCMGGEIGLYLAHKMNLKNPAFLPEVVVLDGEVNRSKNEEDGIPLKFDFLSEEMNEKRCKLDFILTFGIPDFRYRGAVTSILSKNYVEELSPFYEWNEEKKQADLSLKFFEQTPDDWKSFYPDCRIIYAENTDHWNYLHNEESTQVIINHLKGIVTEKGNGQSGLPSL